MDVDAAGGWGFCEPFAAEHEQLDQLAAQGAVALDPTDDLDVGDTASRALRVLLGAGCALPHSALRLAVLGSGAHAHSGSRSKCLLELALAGLTEQGLVVRQGYGPLASLAVPDAALPRAEALAYSEFPDEGQLPRYASHHAALLGGGTAGGGRPGSACHAHHGLNRLRRHSSPRQFAHRPVAGVEKAGARRSKRSFGDDIGAQLAKKMRVADGSPVFGAGSGGGFGGGGAMAMSP